MHSRQDLAQNRAATREQQRIHVPLPLIALPDIQLMGHPGRAAHCRATVS
jgi:hypothetical protein